MAFMGFLESIQAIHTPLFTKRLSIFKAEPIARKNTCFSGGRWVISLKDKNLYFGLSGGKG